MDRVNVDEFYRMIDDLPEGQLENMNQRNLIDAEKEYEKFLIYYDKNICYLCGRSFKNYLLQEPCIHWLLKRCGFKSNYFRLIYKKYGCLQIESFLRWVANKEKNQTNINDLEGDKKEGKIFTTTILWKNIKWTFDCSKADYLGHKNAYSNFPHYHFEMKEDDKYIIKFSQHHIPFFKEDLFNLDLMLDNRDRFNHSFGSGGVGMQGLLSIDPELMFAKSKSVEESEANCRFQTIISDKDGDGIDSYKLSAMINEHNRSGESYPKLVEKYFADSVTKQVFISPPNTVPSISQRQSRHKNSSMSGAE